MAVSSLVRESIEFILSASLLPGTVLEVVSATVWAAERRRFLTKITNAKIITPKKSKPRPIILARFADPLLISLFFSK